MNEFLDERIPCSNFGCLKLLEEVLVQEVLLSEDEIQRGLNLVRARNHVIFGIMTWMMSYNNAFDKNSDCIRQVSLEGIRRHMRYFVRYFEEGKFY